MKIETVYTLQQPLSHIGESESTVSFLNTIRVVSGGKVQEVFALTGNAIRGMLRDCASRYLLDALNARVGKKEFNILFSGGNISGSMSTDIDQAKKYRELLPIISIFGAGVGNQILQGKMTQGFGLPVCLETDGIIPESESINDNLRATSWKALTGTVNFTRFDDSKNANYHPYLNVETEEKEKDSASTQMRYEVEYLVPGAQLYHVINLSTDCGIEIGAFVSALEEFSKSPILGGMGGKGFGLCNAEIIADGEWFSTIKNGEIVLCEKAEKALAEYKAFLSGSKDEIIEFLGATKNE